MTPGEQVATRFQDEGHAWYDELVTIVDDTTFQLRQRIAELEAANKKAERIIAELDADMKENDSLRKRMATILNETANALHGGELENGLWSWHDLAERAQALRQERDAVREEMKQALRRYAQHTDGCASWNGEPTRCNCGLLDALQHNAKDGER